MMPTDVRCIAASHDVCGEGVVWHPQSNAAFWTDINRRLLHRFAIEKSGLETWRFDQPVTAVLLTTDEQRLVLVLGGRIVVWDIEAGREVETLWTLPEWPQVRCNEARVDPAGVLWFGTMQNNVCADGSTMPVTSAVGKVYSLTRSGGVTEWCGGIGITNTMVWSPDGKWMYFGDTLENAIYRCEFDVASSRLGARETFFAGFARGLPDGSAMDAEGFLWNCRYGGGCVVRVAPDGSVAGVLETPVRNPTTCTFGGDERRTLFFTSAGEAEASREESTEGSLFRCEVQTPGLEVTPFRF